MLTRRLRWAAPWILVIGYLPSLTFLGHMPLDFAIPGTSLVIGFPLPAHAHSDAENTANVGGASINVHEEHCHTNLGSCSDAPYTGSAAFALAAGAIALLGAAALVVALAARWWLPRNTIHARPPVPPPRRFA